MKRSDSLKYILVTFGWVGFERIAYKYRSLFA